MKRLVSIFAMTAALAGAASAQEFNVACAKTGDKRVVEILTPGEVGQTCDVRYTRNDSDVSVPYHADNSADYCEQKAAELVDTLKGAGYACAPVATTVAAAAPAPAPVATAPATTATATQPVAETQASAPAPQEPAVEQPALAAAPTPETAAPQAAPNPALEDKMDAILAGAPAAPQPEQTAKAAPASAAAVHGPAQLADHVEESAPAAQPSSAVGRLVGAEPAEPEPLKAATPVTTVALQEPAAPAEAPAPSKEPPAKAAPPEPVPAAAKPAPAAPAPAKAATAEPAPAPQPVKKAETKDAKPSTRTPEQIILATLNAQVAAWNEGNLDAFMDAYWKSDDLKFVSGANVTKGWSATMKRYRDRYANGGGLGALSLDKTDVELVTDDVAVVTGRFNHVKDGASASGTFSLVLKRIDGVWRIVHDHTNPDPAPTQ